jgi:threonine dehydrogenase-like Zn-dependent dehydrogenase
MNTSDTKTWLITGAGRGMGVDFAQTALAAGHNVVATGRDPDAVSAAAGEDERLLVTALDITDAQSAEHAVTANCRPVSLTRTSACPRDGSRSTDHHFKENTMRGAVMHGPGDVRVEERDAPQIVEPTDAIIRVSAACVCGSDLWPYRGIEDMQWPAPMGHEYAGVVEEVGDDVQTIKPGQFVVGSFWATDNTCEICRAGYQSGCVNRVPMGALGAQADLLRVALADGTLIATPDVPSDDLVPSLLSASDVLGTGWFGAVAAEAGPGKTVAVVGDGAVGLLAVLAAKQLGAERIISMSRHESRQRLAREFGATDIVEARGDEGVAAIKELTDELGAHSVVEAVGTQESMNQALRATRPGGHMGFVGVAHGVALDGMGLFWSLAHVHGGPAPVRRFLPELIDLIWNSQIDPGKVFDLTLPLDEAADAYRAMDQRDAIKVLLRP